MTPPAPIPPLRLLVLGSGGREHALAWRCAQSPHCQQLFALPGNPGTARVAQNLPGNPADADTVLHACRQHRINLVVVGPEAPLVAGVTDALRQNGIAAVGPSQAAAQLEGSKAFAKAFMQRQGIPTAAYQSFGQQQLAQAVQFARSLPLPVVVKASGLAAGKGVAICSTHTEAEAQLTNLLANSSLGEAGHEVVVEAFLDGVEVSFFALCNGLHFVWLPEAKDYKRIGEGNTGPNTGGMGAVSPVPFADDDLYERVRVRILEPTLRGLHQEGLAFNGFLFLGLMVVQGEPYLLEYNVRLGDPETQAILPRLDADLAVLLWQAASGEWLHSHRVGQLPDTAVTVVVAAQGYPGPSVQGTPLQLPPLPPHVQVFLAGVEDTDNGLRSRGGRVLAFTALHQNPLQARSDALEAAAALRYADACYRTDIGLDVLPPFPLP